MKRCKLDCAMSSGVGCQTNSPPNWNSLTGRLCVVQRTGASSGLGSARVSRVGFSVLAETIFSCDFNSKGSSRRRDTIAPAAAGRDACATRSCSRRNHRQVAISHFMKTTLAHQLADYTCALGFEDLSPAVVHEVKRRVIDSFGCALGAWNEEPCVIARKVASEFSAKNGSTIIGTDHKAPQDWTAFANGCCIRYFDYNDTYLSKEPAHPSDNISAALAMAESVGARGRELITAIALAYEVQCRFCDAASIRARGWDHPTYGDFSTALACANLMNLDPEKARHAVNIAGVACAAMRQARVGELSHWKGVAFANAARHGVYSALLA